MYQRTGRMSMEGSKMEQNERNVSPMSNEGRNSYVIKQLTGAMLELLRDRSAGEISVSELCDRAGVGRTSFYRNFESKEDVIAKHLRALLSDWAASLAGREELDLVEAIFEHYYFNSELYLCLIGHGLSHLCLDSIREACGPKPEMDNMAAYTAAYFAYGLYGWVEEWFSRGMAESPGEMSALWHRAQEVQK